MLSSSRRGRRRCRCRCHRRQLGYRIATLVDFETTSKTPARKRDRVRT